MKGIKHMTPDDSPLKNENSMPEYPEIAPEEKIGVTAKEKEWQVKKTPRPLVPRYIFACVIAALVFAVAVSGIWYYRKNILPEKYYMWAISQFKAENYHEALELFERAAKIEPSRRNIYNYMARSFAGLGETDNALSYYELHLRNQPDDTTAMIEASELYVGMKDYKKALALLEKAAQKSGGGEVYERLADVALFAEDKPLAGASLNEAAKAYADREKVLLTAKKLMRLGFYGDALSAYRRAAKMNPDDMRALHGANAAKAMLGIPINQSLIIKPGVSLGSVKLGADKDEVKAVMGVPEKKTFVKINRSDVEIWNYGEQDIDKSMAIFFVGGTVKEIETRYKGFKTETGLGAGNFLLERYSSQTTERTSLGTDRLRLDVKGGGLAFFAAGINEAGNGARFAKLIVHKKGENLLEEDQSSWLKNILGM